MQRITIFLLAWATFNGQGRIFADDPDAASDRVRVAKFLKEHVIGKTIVTPKTAFKADNGKMEGEYQDLTSYSNFAETASGFSFDYTTVSQDMRYDLDKDGKRVLPGRETSGTEVYRYEFCERASTKKLMGTARPTTATTKTPSRDGSAILVTGIKIADGKLLWEETLPGYADFFAANGKYKPGSWDSRFTYSIVEGKLWLEYQETKRYDVDPDTLKRTPTNDKFPVFLSKEAGPK
jgi:hypothetical protein